MIDQPLPDTDHVARYCSAKTLSEEGRPLPAAFELRKNRPEESCISVDWLEFCDPSERQAQISSLRKVLEKRLNVGGTAKIAVLNVGKTKTAVKSKSPDRRLIEITHQPAFPEDPHTGIFNVNHGESRLTISLIISEEVEELHEAKNKSAEL